MRSAINDGGGGQPHNYEVLLLDFAFILYYFAYDPNKFHYADLLFVWSLYGYNHSWHTIKSETGQNCMNKYIYFVRVRSDLNDNKCKFTIIKMH